VVGVALQIGQHAVGRHMVGVPGMHHAKAFALAVCALALQTVMLDVVDDLQQQQRHD